MICIKILRIFSCLNIILFKGRFLGFPFGTPVISYFIASIDFIIALIKLVITVTNTHSTFKRSLQNFTYYLHAQNRIQHWQAAARLMPGYSQYPGTFRAGSRVSGPLGSGRRMTRHTDVLEHSATADVRFGLSDDQWICQWFARLVCSYRDG